MTFSKKSIVVTLIAAVILLFGTHQVGFGKVAIWNPSWLPGFGISSLMSSTINANITSASLTRGSPFATRGTAAGNALRRTLVAARFNLFTATTTHQSVASIIIPGAGSAALLSLAEFFKRKFTKGQQSEILQYAINAADVKEITIFTFVNKTSIVAVLSPVNLTALQDILSVPASGIRNFRLDGCEYSGNGAFNISDAGSSTELTLFNINS